jgi:hypothetical protein
MGIFDGEFGLQFVTHLANRYTLPDLVRLARLAADEAFSRSRSTIDFEHSLGKQWSGRARQHPDNGNYFKRVNAEETSNVASL